MGTDCEVDIRQTNLIPLVYTVTRAEERLAINAGEDADVTIANSEEGTEVALVVVNIVGKVNDFVLELHAFVLVVVKTMLSQLTKH